MISDLKKYRDSFGLLCQANGDGGDSCNRTMAAAVYYEVLFESYYDEFLQYGFSNMAAELGTSLGVDLPPGRYCRHPGQYPNPDNFSRDQSIVLQAAAVMEGAKHYMRLLAKARAKRLFFHFNTQDSDHKFKLPDPPAPIEFSQFIRGLRLWWLYPLLLVLDLQLVFDLLVTRPITKSQGNKDFDTQYLPILLSCLHKYNTPWTLIAKRLYAKIDNVESELTRYFAEGPGLNGLAPLGELACLAYKTVIKGL